MIEAKGVFSLLQLVTGNRVAALLRSIEEVVANLGAEVDVLDFKLSESTL